MIPAIGKRPVLNIKNSIKETIIDNNIIEKDVQATTEIEEEESSTSAFQKLMKKKASTIKIDEEEIKMENFFETSTNNYEEFNERAYKKGEGYKVPGYPMIEKHLEGVESGLYLFSGESNSGKSAAMMNIIKDMCSCEENNLFGIYYSLDDSKHEIIPRIIAMEQSIPIGVASKPKRYQDLIDLALEQEASDDNTALYQSYLEKREIGLNKLKSESNKFLIEDADKIKTSSDIKNHIKMVKTFLKTYYTEQGQTEKAEKMNVIIAIDALNDIKLDPKVYGRIRKEEASEEVAKFVKDLSVEFDIVVFASTHLRKLNGNRRPSLDDLREANTLVYEASVVWLVYNDVSKNKMGASIYWNNNGEYGPILEMDWAKNKKSSYKGRTFNKFSPNLSQIRECSQKEMEAYELQINQA